MALPRASREAGAGGAAERPDGAEGVRGGPARPALREPGRPARRRPGRSCRGAHGQEGWLRAVGQMLAICPGGLQRRARGQPGRAPRWPSRRPADCRLDGRWPADR
eukprot:4288658-Alexandrium_andersonii.AAC.1